MFKNVVSALLCTVSFHLVSHGSEGELKENAPLHINQSSIKLTSEEFPREIKKLIFSFLKMGELNGLIRSNQEFNRYFWGPANNSEKNNRGYTLLFPLNVTLTDARQLVEFHRALPFLFDTHGNPRIHITSIQTCYFCPLLNLPRLAPSLKEIHVSSDIDSFLPNREHLAIFDFMQRYEKKPSLIINNKTQESLIREEILQDISEWYRSFDKGFQYTLLGTDVQSKETSVLHFQNAASKIPQHQNELLWIQYFLGRLTQENETGGIEFFDPITQSNNADSYIKSDALYRMGLFYEKTDPQKAQEFYEQASTLDHADALEALARLLENSPEPNENRKDIPRYKIKAAALKGNQEALSQYCEILALSPGNFREKPIEAYQQAAFLGNKEAIQEIIDYEKDHDRMLPFWKLRLKAEEGDTNAMLTLTENVRFGLYESLEYKELNQALRGSYWKEKVRFLQIKEALNIVQHPKTSSIEEYRKARDLIQSSRLKSIFSNFGIAKQFQATSHINPEDREKALNHYKVAAEDPSDNHIEAMEMLVTLYQSTDRASSRYWAQRAEAAKGNWKAMELLGEFHQQGQGTDVDENKAVYFYSKLIEKSTEKVRYDIMDRLSKLGDETNKKYWDAHLKAIDDDAEAMNYLAQHYQRIGDDDVSMAARQENYKKSFEWAQKSALAGNTESMRLLEQYYFQGIGCNKDESLGTYWGYRFKAETGDANAMHLLGDYYKTKGDNEKSKDWYNKAVAREHIPSIRVLWNLELETTNDQEATNLYWNKRIQIAETFNSQDQKSRANLYYELVLLCQTGQLGEARQQEAAQWCQKAKDAGHPNATSKLSKLKKTLKD